jgi:hypothetical protein
MDERLHGGQQERCPESADDRPEHDDRGQALRKRHRQRTDRVAKQPKHVRALAAEQIADLAADQDERGRNKRLERDRRLHAADGRVQIVHHRRDRHVHHRWAFAPGLLLIGLGLGVMLTPSVNLVQSAFPEEQQGEISGLSRSVSNLGSSFGTAIAGTILVSDLVSGNGTYVAAMIVLAVVALAGLAIATRLPTNQPAPSR